MIAGAPANAIDFGAIGNGTTNDSAAILLANNSGASSIVFSSGVYLIGTNITLSADVYMMAGARFKVSSGVVLTLNGAVHAGQSQYIFEGDAGAIRGTLGHVDLCVDWFGASADSSFSATPTGTDSGIGINKAINLANSSASFRTVNFTAGVYLIETPIVSPVSGISINGAGKFVTALICKTTFVGNVMTVTGAGGPPSTLKGFSITSAVGGAFSANGLVVSTNGAFISDIWVSGFAIGVTLSHSDQFFFDFAVELCTTGVYCTSSNVNISNGTIYGCQFGLSMANIPITDIGPVIVTNLRVNEGVQIGILVSDSHNVVFSACSVSNFNSTTYSIAGFLVNNNSSRVIFDACVARLGTPKTSSFGFDINGGIDCEINGCAVEKYGVGIRHIGNTNFSINGGSFIDNDSFGILIESFANLIINGARCVYNGTASVSDAGIKIIADTQFQRLVVTGNIAGGVGGGVQDYGILITCTNADSFGIVANNSTPYNTLAGILVNGANFANITLANNIT